MKCEPTLEHTLLYFVSLSGSLFAVNCFNAFKLRIASVHNVSLPFTSHLVGSDAAKLQRYNTSWLSLCYSHAWRQLWLPSWSSLNTNTRTGVDWTFPPQSRVFRSAICRALANVCTPLYPCKGSTNRCAQLDDRFAVSISFTSPPCSLCRWTL